MLSECLCRWGGVGSAGPSVESDPCTEALPWASSGPFHKSSLPLLHSSAVSRQQPYTDCLPSCPPSCLDLEGHCEGTSPRVPPTCKEGCLLHSGFVLNKDKCIPRIQCDCKDAHGALIPVSGLGEWECLLLLGFLFLSFLLLLGCSCLYGWPGDVKQSLSWHRLSKCSSLRTIPNPLLYDSRHLFYH